MTALPCPSSASAHEPLLAALGVLSFSEAEFESALGQIRATGAFLGRGEHSELLSEVLRWRRFYTPSALYGHRLGANVAIVSHYPFADHDDLFVVDNRHVTKNAVLGEESRDRVCRARERRLPVIGFFGGSTVQGYGARLPPYTIPAQAERILALRHGIDAVCVNYGVAGWTCAESLHLLIHEATGSIDIAVFYDGWNCCNEFFLRSLASKSVSRNSARPVLYPGTSFQHYEQDYLAGIHYSVPRMSRRLLNLSVNHLCSLLAKCWPGQRIKQWLNSILQRYFTIADVHALREELDRPELRPEEERSAVEKAAAEYLSAHAKVVLWCQANGIRLLHALQPLLPNSRKQLTEREESFSKSGLPWGKPHLVRQFRDNVKGQPGLLDLSSLFDEVVEEGFIDTGHLNMRGNFRVALCLADLLAQDLADLPTWRG